MGLYIGKDRMKLAHAGVREIDKYLKGEVTDIVTYVKTLKSAAGQKNAKTLTALNAKTIYNCYNLPLLTTVYAPYAVTLGGGYRDYDTDLYNGAFSHCIALEDIYLPNVLDIGQYAFYGCTAIKDIEFPIAKLIGEGTFRDCVNLKSVSLPLATEIEMNAFCDCTSLVNVNLPKAKIIGHQVFSGCPNLKELNLPEAVDLDSLIAMSMESLVSLSLPKLTTWSCTFQNMPELSQIDVSGVEIIDGGELYNCPKITSINLPACRIAQAGMFFDCKNLAEVSFSEKLEDLGGNPFRGAYNSNVTIVISADNPYLTVVNNIVYNKSHSTLIAAPTIDEIVIDDVTEIGKDSFRWNLNLTNLTLKDGITSIGSCAFSYCEALQSVTIPESVTSIGDGCFSYCEALQSVTIPSSISVLNPDTFFSCSSLTSVTIPESVTSIGDGCFSYCEALQSVTIPESVTSIGEAFDGCANLTELELHEGLVSIECNFVSCTSLQRITIPSTVTSLQTDYMSEWYGFKNCTSLSTLILKPLYVCNFINLVNTPIASGTGYIYVPSDLIDSYKTSTGWKGYSTQFRAIEDYSDICN